MPSRSQKVAMPQPKATAPVFDTSALAKLTAKIDRKIVQNNKDGQKRKRKIQGVTELDQSPPPPKKNSVHAGAFSDKESREQLSSDALLNEILALGGDEDDLKLVADVESESENDEGDGEPGLDAALRAEVASFAAGLGFENHPGLPPDESDDPGGDGDNKGDHGNAPQSSQVTLKRDAGPSREGKLRLEPRSDWHETPVSNLPAPTSDQITSYATALSQLKAHAQTLLDHDVEVYGRTVSSSPSHKFMSTIMSSGTMSDKVSALTLAIQESPVHNMKSIDGLMNLAAKKSRGPAISALGALVDLLGPGLILPTSRRLRTFTSQPGLIGTLQKESVTKWRPGDDLPGKIKEHHLILWMFEDWLKIAYFKIVQIIERWCDDEVEYSRLKAVDFVYALLKDKPEQESNLLRLLSNKLGDRERKIASRASYLLLQLLNVHPGMKPIVVRTVEQEIVFKPGQSIRAKYYAVNTLNQTILSTKEPELADSLLRIYFGMFVSLLKNGDLGQVSQDTRKPKAASHKRKRKPLPSQSAAESPAKSGTGNQEAAEKLTSAILTGVNRAVPFSQADPTTLESHLDTLFRITHSSNFNTSVQALILIQQLSATRHLATDRFYRTLYESLLDPRLATSSKQALYINLLYRALKTDPDMRRVKAFVKRLLQVLNIHQPHVICGILYLIMELCAVFPDLRTLLTQPEELDTAERDLDSQAKIHGGHEVAISPGAYYDGRKRHPEYSNAHRSCLWELLPFLTHFHPSVAVFASNVLDETKPSQRPDLTHHTLIHFLDKFVYRNAKATETTRGPSIMQPIRVAGGQDQVLVVGRANMATTANLNSASFWNKTLSDVAVDDVFFHNYFNQVGKPAIGEQTSKTKKPTDATREADDEDSAAEDEIWQALVNSKPEVQDDSDNNIGFDDFMSLESDDGELDGELSDLDSDDTRGDGDSFRDMFGSDNASDAELDPDPADGTPLSTDAGDAEWKSDNKNRRKVLKSLPTFASADDYAAMLMEDNDDHE